METMKALVKEGRTLSVQHVPRPQISAPDDVLIRVAMAGICRTDVYAAEGRIPCKDPLILGHEFSGMVQEVGSAVQNLHPGARVTAMPWIDCGSCEDCRSGSTPCSRSRMLGVDQDGAFAEYIVIPAGIVYPLPSALPFKWGAYTEPVAASLAVLKAGIQPQEQGLLYGANRIARLTQKILAAHGFTHIQIYDPEIIASPNTQHPMPNAQCPMPNIFDFAIETSATTETLHEIVRAVRPRGKVILKSRPYRPVGIDIRTAVLKELTFHAVNYGSFEDAISLLASGRIDLDDLLGPAYPLDRFKRVFADSVCDESTKSFFALAEEADLPG